LEEVKAISRESSVLIVKAKDRFGDYGLVGTSIIRNAQSGTCEVDTLLMSCRVLGRGVEDAFLRAMATTAAGMGASRLRAPFVTGPRNQVLKDFLVRSQFQEIQPGIWELAIDRMPAMPNHVQWVAAQRFVDSAS